MQVSFIIPLFNCLALTQAMLASLRETVPPGLSHEIIFVDDGSTDGTRAWLSRLAADPGVRVILQHQNTGYAAANNAGAAIARGEFLALLNNDLILTPRWLEPMLDAHRSLGPRAGLIGNVQRDAATGAIDHAGIAVEHRGKPEHIRSLSLPLAPHLSFLTARVRSVAAVTGACLLIRRDLWQHLGGFDPIFVNGCEDIDLCFRARATGRLNLVALRSVVRHHISSSPGRKLRDEANTRRLVLRWRDALVPLAARAWCRHHLATHLRDPRDFPDQADARRALYYALHLRATAPAAALSGVHANLDIELVRWAALGL